MSSRSRAEEEREERARPRKPTKDRTNTGLLIEAEIISHIRDREACLDFLRLICCGVGRYATNTAMCQQVRVLDGVGGGDTVEIEDRTPCLDSRPTPAGAT